ncbi:MAG: extracellular solute-binding protein [Bacilli bacterium]
MKKSIILILCALILFGCTRGKEKNDNIVIIYSSAEEYRNEEFSRLLDEKFPQYKIIIEYMPTGDQAAKLLTEGNSTNADISVDMEMGYYDKLSSIMANTSSYEKEEYLEGIKDPNDKFLPIYVNSGCIAINKTVIQEKGLSIPTTYSDLLKDEYKGLIAMPDPKSSGTGYMFFKSLVNTLGEDEAIDYFKLLSNNILQFTSSGSGPVNLLVQKEVAIGLAMTGQVITEINKGENLECLFFEEGAPRSIYGIGLVDSKKDDPAVQEVFQYFVETLIPNDKEKFFPEKIYKNIDFEVENYPININYANMGNNTSMEKERLLNLWPN